MDRTVADARIHGEVTRSMENIAAEDAPPTQAFWLSFVGDNGFLGAVIVHANDFWEALTRSHMLKVIPGGECASWEIPAETARMIPEKWKNRLLSREKCKQLDAEMSKLTTSKPD